MRAQTWRWVLAAAEVAAADAALLAFAGVVMGLGGQLRSSIRDIVGGAFTVVGAVLPGSFVGGVTAILTVMGLGWWRQHLLSPALAGDAAAGLPALGAALAGPVYTFIRRAPRRPNLEPGRRGAPPHRVFVAAMAKSLEPVVQASTAVQESF